MRWPAWLPLILILALAPAARADVGYFTDSTTRHIAIRDGVMYRDGQRYGAYVDDTYPGDKQARIYQLHAEGWYRVWIGLAPTEWGKQFDKAMELQEVYPWFHWWQTGLSSGYPYATNASGYILQAFSWELNGCADCDYPTLSQQHTLYCKARTWGADLLIWFFDYPEHRDQVNAAMGPC